MNAARRQFVAAHAALVAGRLQESEDIYRDILKADPHNPEALHLLGVVRYQRGDARGAVKAIEKSLRKRSGDPAPYVNLGAALRADNEPAKAAAALRKALALQPGLSAALMNLGHALQDQGKLDDAVAAYRSYVTTEPGNVTAHLILGDALRKAGRLDEAADAYDTAMVLDPENSDAPKNIAGILQRQGWHQAATVMLARAVEVAPDDANVRRDHAVELLRAGALLDGWQQFDQRFFTATQRVIRRPAPPPYWDGSDLSGKTILVWTEQGVGDEILYASMLPDILSRAERCIVVCSPRIAPVLRRSFPGADILAGNENTDFETPPGVDLQTSLTSAGTFLRAHFADFPKHTGYLLPQSDEVARLRERYKKVAGDRRIVGLSWRSTVNDGEQKSIDADALVPALRTPGIMFVSLQYGDCSSDLRAMRAGGIL